MQNLLSLFKFLINFENFNFCMFKYSTLSSNLSDVLNKIFYILLGIIFSFNYYSYAFKRKLQWLNFVKSSVLTWIDISLLNKSLCNVSHLTISSSINW